MASDLKVQCPSCNSILVMTADELRRGVHCGFCGEDFRPSHEDANCSFCRGEGFALVGDVVWICELGSEL